MNQLALRLTSPAATTVNGTRLLLALTQHRGAANGIRAKDLAAALLITERAVREAVTELRMQGIGVGGRPETGYFIATSAAELEPTLQFIRSRAMTSLVLEARMRNVAVPDLIGQLRVPT